MPVVESIFREYRPSDAERSDRSAGDRLRHRQKVRELIRDNISDIIAEESIIGKDKDRIIKVPLRGIKEYRFVYGENSGGVGQGDGNSQPGQVVGKTGREGQGQGQDRAGDQAGVDYYETDVTLEELIAIMFEDLELPDMERRAMREVEAERSSKRKGYRKVGIRVRLDKRRTAKQRIVRMLASRQDEPAANGEKSKGRFPFHYKDLKYRHVEAEMKKESNAVVMCIMDTSGSMDTMKKYLARSFFFLLYQFITTRYRNVENRFHRPSYRSQRGDRGGVFPQGRIGRHLHILGLFEGARNNPGALSSFVVEHLCIPLLRRRQLRLGQSGRVALGQGVGRHLQSVWLWRDQAAGVALLRVVDAQRISPARRAQLPDRFDRTQRGHLAILQGVSG